MYSFYTHFFTVFFVKHDCIDRPPKNRYKKDIKDIPLSILNQKTNKLKNVFFRPRNYS